MGGGFTLSGGEPLMQARFAVKLFIAARGMGIHTTLDTNGYYGSRLTDDELDLIDLVMLDMKTWDPERHKRLTGMDVAPTLEFARRLGVRKKPMWVRYVLVPGLTDDPDDVAKTAAFAAGLGNVERVDVLPFHQMGRYKWQKLGIPYTLDETAAPSPDLVERTLAIYREQGLKAV